MPEAVVGIATRGAVAVVAVFAALGLAACGNTSAQDPQSVASPTVATTTASPTSQAPVSDAAIAPVAMTPATFSGAAADKFGQDKVQAAYAEVSEYLGKTTFNESLLRNNAARTPQAYEFATAYMTPAMADAYRKTVRGAFAGDASAAKNLTSMSFYNVDRPGAGVTFTGNGPLVVNHKVDSPQTTVDPNGRLVMTVHETASLRVTNSTGRVLVPIDKTQTFDLVPGGNNGHAWLLDGISSTWQSGLAVPDAG
jgi:hypothetical protein